MSEQDKGTINNNANQNALSNPKPYSTFFKYCSTGQNNAVLKGLFKDHKIRFTQPWALNDPLEFNPILRFENDGQNFVRYLYDGILLPSEEDRLRMRLIEQQVNHFGILSLTKVPDSFDMWSRYANGHKGFLIEFKSDFNKNPCMLSQEGKEYSVNKITYVDEYAINIDLLTDVQSKISLERFNEEMFYKKCSRWQNEIEYRMVRPLTDYPDYKPLKYTPHRDDNIYLFDFDLNCIESVTFGACMTVEDKKAIMLSCKEYGVQFLQACIWRDKKEATDLSGKIELIPEYKISGLLSILDFNFFFQQEHISRPKPIKISQLSDIPYYHREGMAKWLKEIYKIKKSKRSQNS
jgi:hypothetical protein